MPSFREPSQLRDQTQVSCIAGGFFYRLSHQGSPRIRDWVAHPFSSGSSWPRNGTGVSCSAGRFFTSWATTEVWSSLSWLSKREDEGWGICILNMRMLRIPLFEVKSITQITQFQFFFYKAFYRSRYSFRVVPLGVHTFPLNPGAAGAIFRECSSSMGKATG